jgi:hypothetical protein
MATQAVVAVGFKVTLANKHFWQIVEVDAVSENEAKAKIAAYLAGPEIQGLQQEEYQQGAADREEREEEADPAEYDYAIHEVSETDKPTGHDAPHFTGHAGGNG